MGWGWRRGGREAATPKSRQVSLLSQPSQSREDETEIGPAHCRTRNPGPVFWLWTVGMIFLISPVRIGLPVGFDSGTIRNHRCPLQRRVRGGFSPPSRSSLIPFNRIATGFAAARGRGESNKGGSEMQERRI